jgi:hypothetical protein
MKKLNWESIAQNDNDRADMQGEGIVSRILSRLDCIEDSLAEPTKYFGKAGNDTREGYLIDVILSALCEVQDLMTDVETMQRKANDEETAHVFYRRAFNRMRERAERAEAERDLYKNALKTTTILLDDADNMVGCARAIAPSPFAAEGKTMEDLRREFDNEVGA